MALSLQLDICAHKSTCLPSVFFPGVAERCSLAVMSPCQPKCCRARLASCVGNGVRGRWHARVDSCLLG